MNIRKIITVIALTIMSLGAVSACDDTASHNSHDGGSASQSDSHDDDDDTGQMGYMISPKNGSLQPGIDLGNGMSMGMDGSLGMNMP